MTYVYRASQIKRHRATKAQVDERRNALASIVALGQPMTVRQVFYQATVRGIVDKTEGGYNKVQADLVQLRRSGLLPYGWITDSTRWQRRPRTFDSIAEALDDTARLYRKALWRGLPERVEIWLEKDALAGVVYPVTDMYDVPLMVTRGYASLSFLHAAADDITQSGRPTHIYHFGDHDPSGVDAADKIAATLREMAPRAKIHFRRMAVTPFLIEELHLPTRPTKATDSRAKNFGSVSVELDAIPPEWLRALVQGTIDEHLPQHELNVLKKAEESERQLLISMTRDFIAEYRA